MSRKHTDNIEINDIEYRPYSAERSSVNEFRVGDRIGDKPEPHLVTRSEPDPNDPNGWELDWTLPDGSTRNYVGGNENKDYRWVQSLYIIQEIP